MAAIPPIAGIAGADFASPEVFSPGYRMGMMICAGMLTAAGVFAAAMIQKPKRFEEVARAPEQMSSDRGTMGVLREQRLITQEGLIGFDCGRSIQEKRVENPRSSLKRSLETTSADSKRTDFALAA